MHFSIKKGLKLPLAGEPAQSISNNVNTVKSVAILGNEYVGMKPTMLVEEGQGVKLGQTLFTDKKNPSVHFTAPGAGKVISIKRGAKRALQAVIIELEGDDEITFQAYESSQLNGLNRDDVKNNLLNSGLWTALRTRPYSKSPDPETNPHAIFVTAIDTNPLAANPDVIIKEYANDYAHGLTILSRLTDGKVFVCQSDKSPVTNTPASNVETHTFSGPHPAGLAGTHIHLLAPVSAHKTVWQINYQDVIAIGKLFTTGHLWVERIISLAGPLVNEPRLVRTRLGANTEDLVNGEVQNIQARVISGSVLRGHTAANWAAYLGRFHHQISVIAEAKDREFFGWIKPVGKDKFSALNVFISKMLGAKALNLTTSQNGSPRAMVPVGAFESVMPLDILPTQLLRALIVQDTDSAQALGALELDEEDLALCSFVCSGKFEYGPALRNNLTQIEKEG
jgi:Na+-transporting NADH:ubiquinone oxidoreductase subunit A